MRPLALVAALMAAVIAGGCDTRAPNNPFDPRNPETGGRPNFLTAVARNGFADLRWQDGGMRDIESFSVHRGTDPDTLEMVAALPAVRRTLRDGGLAPGVTYYYAIGFNFEGGGPLLTAPVPATPGPDVPWALDSASSPLVLLSADGRAAVSRYGEGHDFIDLSVESSSSWAWCVDAAAGVLVAYDEDGALRAVLDDFAFPTRVSADPRDGGVWIVSYDAGTLTRVDVRFTREVVDDTLSGPLDVEAAPTGGCWVSDDLGQIHRYYPSGSRTTVAGLSWPAALSDVGREEVWAADPVAREAVRVSPEGVLARTGGLDGPFDVAALPQGGCWIADRKRVLKVDRDGEVLLTVGGFDGARAVSFNPRTGECWVADPPADKIVRIDAEGERVVEMEQLVSPFAIAGRWSGTPTSR